MTRRRLRAGHGETDGKHDQGNTAEGGSAGEGSRDPGCSATRSLRRRRHEDDQAGHEARLRHLRAAQCGRVLGRGRVRTDRGHSDDAPRDGHQRGRDRGGRGRRRGGARGAREWGNRVRRTGQGHAEDADQIRGQGADRAHRRPGAHVSARDGLDWIALAPGRGRHRQAY
jgi:hypothetical protein